MCREKLYSRLIFGEEFLFDCSAAVNTMEGRASDAARASVCFSQQAPTSKTHFFLCAIPKSLLLLCQSVARRDLFALFFFALLYTCARCQQVEREIVGESLARRARTHGQQYIALCVRRMSIEKSKVYSSREPPLGLAVQESLLAKNFKFTSALEL